MSSKAMSRRSFLASAATTTAGVAAFSAFAGTALAGEPPAGGPGGGPGGPGGPGGAAEVTYASAGVTDDGRVRGYCGPGDWLGSKPEIADDQISSTYDVDVVVCGMGGTGCARSCSSALAPASKVKLPRAI